GRTGSRASRRSTAHASGSRVCWSSWSRCASRSTASRRRSPFAVARRRSCSRTERIVRMKSEQLTDNLTRLLQFHFVNAYLVREDDGLTLVETTMGKAADPILAAAARSGGSIKRIALTHGHGDHVGALDALKERLGDGVEVLMPELDAR